MMEMNRRLIESESGQPLTGDGAEAESRVEDSTTEPCIDTEMRPCAATEDLTGDGAEAESRVEDSTKEPCIDTEMRPCAATEAMDGANDSEFCTSVQVTDEVLDNVEVNCSAACKTKEVLDNTEPQPCPEGHAKDVLVATESKSCSIIQLKESGDCAESEHSSGNYAKEVPSSAELENYAKDHKTEGPEEQCLREMVMEDQNHPEVELKEVINDSEMQPCAENHALEILDSDKFEPFSGTNEVKEAPNDFGLEPSPEGHVKDVSVAESKCCSNIQLKESVNCAESEHFSGSYAKEVLSSAELESCAKDHKTEAPEENCPRETVKEEQNHPEVELKEVINDSEMEPCTENHALEILDSDKFEPSSGNIAPNDFGLEPCTKNRVKEATNDDIHSEVSNPNLSPKHVTSTLTNSSQLDVLGSDNGGCGEITSACCRSSFVDQSSCEEEHSKSKSESVSKAYVVLEIPKHVRPTGIRKITFKFSKRKGDYDGDLSVAVKPLADDRVHEEVYDNQLSVSPAGCLTSNGFQKHGWNTSENEDMNISMDDIEFPDTQSPSSCVANRELKMSKKIVPDNYPTNVKKLLSTRILEGARVKYISISGEKVLPGIIKDCGYLCGCCICNFSKVVSAYEFELHAGTKTRHPNNHIYLENGKPIYSIIQEMRTAPLSTIDSVIKAVAGSSLNEEYFKLWKASLRYGNDVAYAGSEYQSRHFDTCHSTTSYPSHSTEKSPYPASCQYSHSTPFNQPSYIEVPVEKKRLIKKPRHNILSSFWEQKKVGEGGNKKRDNDLHKLLFMPNGLPDGTSVAYYSKGKRILGGYKQGNGIVCSCCNCEISPSQFEAHAGWAAKRQPYRHIYTSSGLTLHDIALMLANGQNLASSGSDDMCTVCGDRGELIICNGCPRAFHAACLGLQCLPTNDWHCPFCRDKFGAGRKASGESRHIILRLKRVVKAPEFEPGGCVICRSQAFSAVKFDDLTVIICDQCEKEYHVGCLRESGMCDLKELPEDKWFCCDVCYKIFEALQNLVSSGPEVIPASVSATVYEKHAKIGFNIISKNDIQWCILSGKSRFAEHLLLLSRAAAIFRECFDPIVAKSGRDLIPVMVYGRNISGQEFSGMYCVVLIVQSVVVSAALLRIFGRDVAELPLVATCRENQGKGYFQALFSCIERLLSSMSVKHLVIPAAEEAEPMWTNKLGFRKTSSEQMLKYRDFQLTIFNGTSLLEKEVQQ